MAVNLSPVGGVAAQFFSNNGAPLTGGKLYTYAAGTTTPQATYTTSAGNVFHSNPIVLDSAGRVPNSGEIWLTDGLNYKFLLKDSNDVLIATYDNISGINSNFIAFTNQQEIQTATAGQTVFNLGINYQPGTNSLSVFVDGVNQYGSGAQYAYVETNSNTVTFNSGLHVGAEVKFTTSQQQGAGAVDAEQVSYTPPFTGSVATNVEAKLAQTVSVKDFGAVGDGVTDDTAAIQAAIDAAQSSGAVLVVPAGVFKVTATLTPDNTKPLTLCGEGFGLSSNEKGTVFKLYTATDTLFYVRTNNAVAHSYSNFSCVNASGGSTEIAMDVAGAFIEVNNVNIYDFEYGVKAASTLYCKFDRLFVDQCDYGISLWSYGTPPFTLNSNYYNNLVSITNTQVTDCITGIRVSGAGISMDTVDVSRFTTYGIQLGSSDFNQTQVELSNLYFEGATGTPIYGYNAYGVIGSVFFGQGFTTGIDLTSCRFDINNANCYATVTTLVSNTNGRIWLGNVEGSAITRITNSGTGVSVDQNLLNTYQEGTWTVGFYDAGTGGNQSPTTATGSYTRIGNQVTISFRALSIDTTGMTAGNVLYFNLPFTSNATITYGQVYNQAVTYPAGTSTLVAFNQGSVSRNVIQGVGSGVNAANLLVSNLTSGSARIGVTMTYFVS